MTVIQNNPDLIRILRKNEVCEITGLGKTSIYRLIAAGKFPAQVHLGNRSVGWYEHDINNWLETLVSSKKQGS